MNYVLHHCVAIKVEKKKLVYLSDVIFVHFSFFPENKS